MDFTFRFTFHLQNRVQLEIGRKDFGSLLKKLNLKYRTQKNFLLYQSQDPSNSYAWTLDFLILSKEYQQEHHLENLRYLIQSLIQEFEADHPELGGVDIYRNLNSFPYLILETQDWW